MKTRIFCLVIASLLCGCDSVFSGSDEVGNAIFDNTAEGFDQGIRVANNWCHLDREGSRPFKEFLKASIEDAIARCHAEAEDCLVEDIGVVCKDSSD